MRATLALLLSIAALTGSAQQPSDAPDSSAKPSQKVPTEAASTADTPGTDAIPIPTVTLTFKDRDPIPGAPASSAWMAPVQCSPDGVPLVAFYNQSNPLMPDFFALDSKGGVAFRVSAAPGLYDVHYMTYFVSNSLVIVQVNATRDPTKQTRAIRPDRPPQEMYTGKHHNFLIEFDPNGTYKQTIELPADYGFGHIAALPDGTFVDAVYDQVNSVARLLLLDSSGEILHPLQIPQQMQNDPALVQGQTGDFIQRGRAQTSLSWWLFGAARGKVLLYRARAHAPVLEIGPGGAMREVPVTAPASYALSGIISSNDRWIMQFRREGLSDHEVVDARPQSHNFLYCEIDPNDGSLKRRIDFADDSPMPACEHDGVVVAFRSGDGKIVPTLADLPR